MDKRQGYFIGLALVVVLALAITAWQVIAQTTKGVSGSGEVGRFQIVVAKDLESRANESVIKKTSAFLLDTQTGRIWRWEDHGIIGDRGSAIDTTGWQEVGVSSISEARIPIRSFFDPSDPFGLGEDDTDLKDDPLFKEFNIK